MQEKDSFFEKTLTLINQVNATLFEEPKIILPGASEKKTDGAVLKAMCEHKKSFNDITAEIVEIEMYKSTKTKEMTESYLVELEKQYPTVEERILIVYAHLLGKLDSTDNFYFATGAVICLFPIINKYLNEYAAKGTIIENKKG